MLGQPTRITDGVFQLRAIGSRVTVFAEPGDAIFIDSGLPSNVHSITHGLTNCGISLDQISRVVISHAHPDHYGGLAELVDKAGIAVAVHEAEADIVEGDVPAPSPFRSRFFAALARPAMSRLTVSPVPVSLRLKDRDLIRFPTEVRVVHLPGHTPGSICLYLP